MKEGDGLVRVEYMRETTADSSILLVTEGGMSIRFASDTVPVTGPRKRRCEMHKA